jgi:hypothetical protein
MSTGSSPSTIGQVIESKLKADRDVSAAQDAAEKADASYKQAQAVVSQENGALQSALAAVGGAAFVANDDGSITVFVTDQSGLGFHSFSPASASTSLPGSSPEPPTPPSLTPSPESSTSQEALPTQPSMTSGLSFTPTQSDQSREELESMSGSSSETPSSSTPTPTQTPTESDQRSLLM